MDEQQALVLTVTVSGNPPLPTITVSPDPVNVNAANSLLVFNLATPGWQFPTEGAISFQLPAIDEFPSLWYIGPQQIALLDVCNQAGQYRYWLSVQHQESQQIFKHDPYIKNGSV